MDFLTKEILEYSLNFTQKESKLLEELSILAKSITFLQGDLIIEQNEKGNSLYIITYGQVTIYKTGHKNDPIAVLGPGDFFGEMAFFSSQKLFAPFGRDFSQIMLILIQICK